MKKLKELEKKVEDLSKTINKELKGALKEAAADIFAKYPKLENFWWTQYTPYFNDGEPCEFRINGDEPGYTYGDYECDHYDSALDYEGNLCEEAAEEFKDAKEAEKLEDTIKEFISALEPMENHVKSILGEGKVIVTKKGVEVEDYDHD